jgi:DNA-binding MarR family transcriptional regulator
MTLEDAVERVQFAFPQIYYACHTRHTRRRSNDHRVSARDAELLVHLDRRAATTVSDMADHMDLARSTVSEALTRLESLGYVRKTEPGADRRRVGVILSETGVAAVQGSSVLEPRRLRRALEPLSPAGRARAVSGLCALARACRTPARARAIRRPAGEGRT